MATDWSNSCRRATPPVRSNRRARTRSFRPIRRRPSRAAAERRYYVGGNIYTKWASVPDRYKSVDTQRPDPTNPGGSTASIFTFSW
jgi:hypothetical protein